MMNEVTTTNANTTTIADLMIIANDEETVKDFHYDIEQ